MGAHEPATDKKYIKLLNGAARVAQSVTSILDLDLLLRRAVGIICDEFELGHIAIFLLDETGQEAVLRAGQSACGADTLSPGDRLSLDDNSLIGAAIKQRKAQVVLDIGAETPFKDLRLSKMRSAIALPLETGGEMIGTLTAQSEERRAFTQANITALQIIADQLAIAAKRSDLYQQIQELLYQSARRARLLGAANAVGRSVTSILNLDELLTRTVDAICETYGFYYAGVFLLDESGEWAVLQAGHGAAGAAMIAAGHKLKVAGNSMIGAAIRQHQARIALDVDVEAIFLRNPYLPDTRSEMALPLLVEDKALGAVTIQSIEERAFGVDDVTSLQTMADYLAVAINNAQTLQKLKETNAELLRSKTFEMIATATGEAIHWVGNKAAPIPGSVARITEDLTRYLVMINALMAQIPPDLSGHKFAQMLADAAQDIVERGIDLTDMQAELERLPLRRLQRVLSVESIFEDLHIIQSGANAILNIKEDLVGPARRRHVELISITDLLREVIASRGIPSGVVRTILASDLPPVHADKRQLDRVFVNLIKNAMEAMAGVEKKKLLIWTRLSSDGDAVEIDIIDNGVGIPPDQIDKIWVAFYTTKGEQGGTGLGLAACLEIVKQAGGRIWLESEVGQGTTFTISLPVAKE